MDTARDRNPDAACVMSNELGNRNVKCAFTLHTPISDDATSY